jgi:hypothetical protein
MEERKPESKGMTEEEKTAEVWETEKKERMERASGDIAEESENTIVNPPSAGGKRLHDKSGVEAAGARCGYPSRPCDR